MSDAGDGRAGGDQADEGIARFVADADVLAADLLVGGPARGAIDLARGHSWITLVASEPLLSDAEGVIAELADESLAADWREEVGALVELVAQPEGDHPAIASAYRGDARHVLSFDESLLSAAAGAAVRDRVETSVKHPAAFVRLFDPASVHREVGDGPYDGPDRDPRG